MKVGFVQLVDFEDNVIRYATYSCKSGREKTINMWKKEYANKLNNCAIHISPDDKYCEETVNEKTGMNCRKDYKERRRK